MNESIKKAIEEIKALEEAERVKYDKERYPLFCPCCGVALDTERDYDSPNGIKLVFKQDAKVAP